MKAIFFICAMFFGLQNCFGLSQSTDPEYLFDEHRIRYQLVVQNPEGEKTLNWLFIPGGPGCDSSSLLDLAQMLELPGNVWLIDFPGNGSNTEGISADYDYNEWFDLMIPMVKRFENPVIVGASWGGIISLLTPELENHLVGFVALNTTPKLWLEAAAQCAKKHNLPNLDLQMQMFIQHPSQETFDKTLDACIPYWFYKKELLEERANWCHSIAFSFRPAMWGLDKLVSSNYSATWIPEKVPTLILGSEFDWMTPFELFQNDPRFLRDNIEFCEVKEAGHFSWIDNPSEVKAAFEKFSARLKS